ncbi:MAG TPA: transposase [Nitrososphaeraceae archaeon]|nr:transposase [Nitrososphaeraceae archaeon]
MTESRKIKPLIEKGIIKSWSSFRILVVISISWHSLRLDLRLLTERSKDSQERGLPDYIRRIEEMHFTHIRRRLLKIRPSVGQLNFEENDKPITLIVDASGLTVSKKGDYIEEKWIREKKEFIKLQIAVDEKSKKVISFRITKGNVHDTRKFGPLVKKAAEKHEINKIYADKAYDNRNDFNILDDINIEPAIIIRKNASTTNSKEGCPLRRDEVLLIKKLGFEGWKQLKDAGRRWIAEIVFSSIKRVLGEKTCYQRNSVLRK